MASRIAGLALALAAANPAPASRGERAALGERRRRGDHRPPWLRRGAHLRPARSGLRGPDRGRFQPGARAQAGPGVAAGRSDHLGVRAAPERPLPRRHAAHRRRRRVQHRTGQGRSSRRPDRSLAGRIESIAEVRAVDDHTVRIETKFPDPQLWDKVRPIYIMSKRWAEAHDASVPVERQRGRGELRVAARERHRPFYPEGVRAQRASGHGPQPRLVGLRALSPQPRPDRVHPDRRPRGAPCRAAPRRPRPADRPSLRGARSDRDARRA